VNSKQFYSSHGEGCDFDLIMMMVYICSISLLTLKNGWTGLRVCFRACVYNQACRRSFPRACYIREVKQNGRTKLKTHPSHAPATFRFVKVRNSSLGNRQKYGDLRNSCRRHQGQGKDVEDIRCIATPSLLRDPLAATHEVLWLYVRFRRTSEYIPH